MCLQYFRKCTLQLLEQFITGSIHNSDRIANLSSEIRCTKHQHHPFYLDILILAKTSLSVNSEFLAKS